MHLFLRWFQMNPRLPVNSVDEVAFNFWSSCIYFPVAGVTGLCHRAKLVCAVNQTWGFYHARQAFYHELHPAHLI